MWHVWCFSSVYIIGVPTAPPYPSIWLGLIRAGAMLKILKYLITLLLIVLLSTRFFRFDVSMRLERKLFQYIVLLNYCLVLGKKGKLKGKETLNEG